MYETYCQENKQWQENLACFHNGIAVFNFNLNWLLLWKKIPPKFILLYCLDLRLKKEITSSLAKSIAITLMRYLILSNPNIPKRVLLNKELFIQPSASSAKKKNQWNPTVSCILIQLSPLWQLYISQLFLGGNTTPLACLGKSVD